MEKKAQKTLKKLEGYFWSEREIWLGFRDIQYFNIDLLDKQVWRILTNPNLLISKVVKGRYFPKSSILEAKNKIGDSWIWQSLVSSTSLLVSGLRK